MSVIEKKLLRWMSGDKRKDKMTNEDILSKVDALSFDSKKGESC